MKIKNTVAALLLAVISLFIISLITINHIKTKSVDVTQVNDLVKTIEEKGPDSEDAKKTAEQYGLKYTSIDGYITVYHDSSSAITSVKRVLTITLAAVTAILCGFLIFTLIYFERNIIIPFERMKSFAASIAAGNLDAPLEQNKNNLFGAFTESFDMMREELADARENERKANESKKELVASLSHDIKTPLASIKAITEVLSVKSEDEKQKEKLDAIERKTNQIEILINNLFHAALDELHELKVEPIEFESTDIAGLIKSSDYDHRVSDFEITECLVYCDPMRLQQVFDNIISNSYKYAGTQIIVSSIIEDGFLLLRLRDFGAGVPEEERPLLLQKYYRGSNSKGKSGSGIGLYVSAYFMNKMKGSLQVPLSEGGFEILLKMKLV